MDDPDIHYLIDSVGNMEKRWRYFVLDGEQITCSRLMTRHEAYECQFQVPKEKRSLVVDDALLDKYDELEPGGIVLQRVFTSHSELGAIGMFWELLSRARKRHLDSEGLKENEQT